MKRSAIPGLEPASEGKAKGLFPVSSRSDGSLVSIPVLVAEGKTDGPTLSAFGGVHGDEYVGPEAIRMLWNQLDCRTLRGRFIGVPTANPVAWESQTRTSWTDGLNLNRVFPGNPNGTITERIAHCLGETFISTSDFVVDCHSGATINRCSSLVIYEESPTVLDETIMMAKSANLEIIWRNKDEFRGTLSGAARQRGIPAITIEVGGEGRVPFEDVSGFISTLRNLMIGRGMIDDGPPEPRPQLLVEGTIVSSRVGGVFRSHMYLGQRVRQGQVLAEIANLLGDVVETVTAPWDGIAGSLRTFGTVEPGEVLVYFLKEIGHL